jgi:hypothetical protein
VPYEALQKDVELTMIFMGGFFLGPLFPGGFFAEGFFSLGFSAKEIAPIMR